MTAATSHARLRLAAAIAIWVAIGAGAFDPFYVRIHAMSTRGMADAYAELPYRRIPGLREFLLETDRRTPPGARILLDLGQRTWKRGYEYAFLRAEFVLATKHVLPLIDERGRIVESRVASADYLVCWRPCSARAGFDVVFRNEHAVLARRAR